MNLKIMTKGELITLKTEVDEELHNRIRDAYIELTNNLTKLITDFEKQTGYYVAVDLGDYDDRATNFINELFYYTSVYIEPYE